MKKKLLVFIGTLIFTLGFVLVVPKTKAQTYTRLVVQSYNVDAGTITFYNYDTQEYFGTFDFNTVYDSVYYITFALYKEYIPQVFRIGDLFELVGQPASHIIQVNFLRPAEGQTYYPLSYMIPNLVYEYKGIVDNMYVLQRGLNFYQVPMTPEIVFINSIDEPYEFDTILKPGNKYVYINDYGNIRFEFSTSPDYEYTVGYRIGLEEGESTAYDAYRRGYEAGVRLAEELVQSEYQRGLLEGTDRGFTNGYNEGYQDGYDDAYREIIVSEPYTQGYEKGFKDGEKSRIAQNNQSFYASIEKWLVPAIIVILVVGGIMSISALKRREA